MSVRSKSSMVATLGASPPVVSELLQYLAPGGEGITDITIIYTSEEDVRASFKLVECAVMDRYPRVRIHGKMVDRPDIASTEDAYEFLKLAARVLRDEVVKHGVQSIHLNLSGGRKGMAIALATLSQFFPVSGAYLVVARDIKTFNQNLERVRNEIRKLLGSPDPMEYYRSKKGLFDPVMYPPRHEYEVVEIPIIPYPPEVLRDLVSLDRVRRGLLGEFVEKLKSAGLVSVAKGGKIYPTETYHKIVEVLREVV